MSCTVDVNELKNIAEEGGVSFEELKKVKDFHDSLSPYMKEELDITQGRVSAKWANRVPLKINDEIVKLVNVSDDKVWYVDSQSKVREADIDDVRTADGSYAGQFVKVLKEAADFYIDAKTGFETRGKDLLNDPDKFKELAVEIDEADSRDISPEHRARLMNVVHTLTDVFKGALPTISVHINKAYDKTGGVIEISPESNTADLYVGIGPNSGNKSALETYAHELTHGAIDFILSAKDHAITTLVHRMTRVLEEFVSTTSAADLAKFMPDQSTAVHDAEQLLKYITEHGLKEFIPHALTNEYVVARLAEMSTPRIKENPNSKGYAYQIIMFIRKAFGMIIGRLQREPAGNDLVKMGWLIGRLIAANNRQMYFKEKGLLGRVDRYIDSVDAKIGELVEKGKEKVLGNGFIVPNQSDSTLVKLGKLGKVVAGSFFDDRLKIQAELQATALGQSPEGILQTLIRNSTAPDKFLKDVESSILQVTNIDRNKAVAKNEVVSTVMEAFGRKLTRKDLAGLDKILRADLIVLEDLETFIDPNTGESTIHNEINAIEAGLESAFGLEIKNYYKGQSLALARYLLTNNGGIALLKNARNIAMRVNDVTKVTVEDENVTSTIDRLVSLYALQQTDAYSKEAMYSLFSNDKEGVDAFKVQMLAMKEESKELFSTVGEQYFEVKGYHKDLYPNNMDIKIGALKDEAEYKKIGYKLISESNNHSLHKRSERMGLYINTMPTNPSYQKTGVRITDKKHRGFTITDSYNVEVDSDYIEKTVAYEAAKRDIARLHTRMVTVLEKQKKGDFTLDKEDENIHPMMDTNGEITNFTYEMKWQDKLDLLGLDSHPVESLAHTVASIYDRVATVKHNIKVMDKVLTDAKSQNINTNTERNLGANLKEYIFISPTSEDASAKEYWALLPRELRSHINKQNRNTPFRPRKVRHGAEPAPIGFYIRRDALHSVLGYRALSVAKSNAMKNTAPEVKHALAVAGAIWTAVVQLAKRNIVIKIPTVFVNNVLSNTILLSVMGNSPLSVMKYQLDGVKELHLYLETARKIVRLETKRRAGVITALEVKQLALFKSKLEQSSIKEMIDAGFYTNIVEEIDTTNHGTGNIVEDYLDSKLKKLPFIVQNGLSFVMFDRKSTYFKAMSQATQYSDFVGRYTLYKINRKKGLSHESAIERSRDAFVNYGIPNSKKLDWFERMGAVLFTKYFVNIQRFVTASFKESPLRVIGGLLALNFLWADAPNPWESTLLTDGPLDRLGNPFDILGTASTPGLVSVYDSMSHY